MSEWSSTHDELEPMQKMVPFLEAMIITKMKNAFSILRLSDNMEKLTTIDQNKGGQDGGPLSCRSKA